MNRIHQKFDVTPDDFHRYNFAMAQFQQLGQRAVELIKDGNITFETKDDGTPVTNIDREIEERFTEAIDKQYMGEDIVLGEELSINVPVPENKRIWRLDPFDGTGWLQRLVESGEDDYSSLRALLLTAHFSPGGTIPQFGIMHSPFYENSTSTISAINGQTYYHDQTNPDGQRIIVRNDAPTDITMVQQYEKNGLKNPLQDVSEEELAKIMPFAERIKKPLFMGNIALHNVDVSVFPGPSQPHDIAAGALAVVNAGGTVKDFDSREFEQIDWRKYPINGVVAGSNENLVDQVVTHYAKQE